MRIWDPTNHRAVRSVGVIIAIFSIVAGIVGSFVNSFVLMGAAVTFLVGFALFLIGHMAARRAKP